MRYAKEDVGKEDMISLKQRKMMFIVLIIALCCSYQKTLCQENRFKVALGYTANQFEFDPNETAKYINGYQAELSGVIVGKKTLLYGLINYERKSDVTQVHPDTYDAIVQRDTNTVGFGARLSHNVGVFEPFAAAILGFRLSNDVQSRKFDRRYQAGGDINLRYFFIRVAAQFERVTGNKGIEQSYLFGGGLRF